MPQTFGSAFRVAWWVISAGVLCVLLCPFVLGEQRVAALAPVCEQRARTGQRCFLCGMTTSFLAISRGDWKEAAHAHGAGIPLYSAFIFNELALVAVLGLGGSRCK